MTSVADQARSVGMVIDTFPGTKCLEVTKAVRDKVIQMAKASQDRREK